MRLKTFATAVATVALAVSSSFGAQPTDPTTAALFAGGTLTFGGYATVAGGTTIANGNVTHAGGGLQTDAMYGGGSFTYTGGAGNSQANGDWYFNGSISNFGGPGSVFKGNMTSAQGSVLVRETTSTAITGNVTAAGDFYQPFSFATVGGNVLAGGNVTVNGSVSGNVTYGGTYTQGTFGSVGGPVTHGGTVSPAAFTPLTLPAGSNLTAGSNNVTLANFENRALTPGTYGTLAFASSNTVSLTAGTYVFAGITNSFSLNQLSFDTSAGPIKVYVAGNLDFNLVQVINGQALFAGGNPNPADAAKITLEVAGSYTGNADLYGTLFAPNGGVTLNTFADVTGRVLAGGNVNLVGSNVVAVPEPTTFAALTLVGGLMLRRRRV
ncbi:MAG: PEP-CTERM sorting domain-containing protein [Tepidisphaeraceae bacterium]